jgi:hypothetical protein
MLDRGADDLRLTGQPRNEQVKIAAGLAPTPQATGRGNGVDAGELADKFCNTLGMLAGNVDAEA